MPHLFNTIHLLRSRLKGLPRDLAQSLGVNQSFLKEARGSRILVYHGICRKDHLKFNTLFVKLKAIEKQLRLYKKYFNIISIDDYYEQRFSKVKFNICLTFDDGFANNYKYVLPLLEQYKIPAAFFITGIREAGYDILWNDVLAIAHKYGPVKFSWGNEDFIRGRDEKYFSSSSGQRFSAILRAAGFEPKKEMMELLGSFRKKAETDYWLQMTEEEIKTLSTSKWVTIGSHGYYHNDLAKLPSADAKEEIMRSKQFLERITSQEIKAIAFPYGSYTNEVVSISKKEGFTQLLATEFLYPENRIDTTMRERLTINPFVSDINQLHAIITGNYK